MPSATETNHIHALAVEQINFTHGFLLGLVDGMEGDQLIHRPNDSGNHVLWVLGHIAVSNDMVVSMSGGGAPILSEAWTPLFVGPDATPTSNAGDYPSLSELIEAVGQSQQKVIDWTQSLDAEGLSTPCPKELEPFAKTCGSVAFSLSGHTMFHAGQVAGARASLGLPRKFM